MKKNMTVFMLLLLLMTVASFVIYKEYIKTKESVFEIIQEHLIDQKVQLLRNYANFIVKKHGTDIIKYLSENPKEQKHYEHELALLQGDEIKYLYLLYQDKKERFRFLLDATVDEDEKAQFNQKFDPQTMIWKNAYLKKTYQIMKQEELQTLWITIAYPLVVDGNVIAVLGADFTYDVYTTILNALHPIETVHYYVNIFMMIMLILAYILIYFYYKSRKKSFIDPLTHTYNRQFLFEFLETNSLQDYQLMMIDIDYFKHVNDSYGHDVGDEVLIHTVQIIKSHIRKNDILIRFGGEEFILLTYRKEISQCEKVANRIRLAVMDNLIETKNHNISITISIGINPFPYFAKDAEEAIKISDEMLYKAKVSGRNCVKVFEEHDRAQSQTSKRISDVKAAIDDDRIRCAFQPIFTANDRKLTKYEMLIRLIDLQGQLIMPNEFLPAVKHTQIYINLTQIVLDTAIKTLNENPIKLTLNLDLQDILNDDIMKLLQERFENNSLLANRLCIEILEHEEIKNFEAIKARIDILKELGLKIAIDDFGSGYSNFRYLLHLNIDILKIDGSLIKDIHKDKHAYYIVQTIVDFAKKIDMQIVAEQIEYEEEYEVVKDLGVDYIQGYYCGRPSFELLENTSQTGI